MELAKKVAGEFVWAHVLLAEVYSFGKFADRAQTRAELDQFADVSVGDGPAGGVDRQPQRDA